MRILAQGKSDVGRRRNNNEDFLLIDEALGLYLVCDGMGGHAAGEVASRTAAETLRSYFGERKEKLEALDGSAAARSKMAKLMRRAIERASEAVYEAAKEGVGRHGMGTTCIAVLVVGDTACMGHVGDSRLYLMRDRQIYLLSEDHTYRNEAVKNGMLTPEQADASPHAHMVTRGVGMQPSVRADTLVFDLLPGDRILLCSDGLYDQLKDSTELGAVIGQGELGPVSQRLVDLANERGGARQHQRSIDAGRRRCRRGRCSTSTASLRDQRWSEDAALHRAVHGPLDVGAGAGIRGLSATHFRRRADGHRGGRRQ